MSTLAHIHRDILERKRKNIVSFVGFSDNLSTLALWIKKLHYEKARHTSGFRVIRTNC